METTPAGLGASFAAEVQEARERRGMTRNGLARALSDRGVPMQQVQVRRIEENGRPVTLAEAVIIGELLGIDLHDWIESQRQPTVEEGLRTALRTLTGMHGLALDLARLAESLRMSFELAMEAAESETSSEAAQIRLTGKRLIRFSEQLRELAGEVLELISRTRHPSSFPLSTRDLDDLSDHTD